MNENKSKNTRLNLSKSLKDRWRLTFLLFAIAYALTLMLTLLVLPLNWDEMVHLNAALNINGGFFDRYLSAAFYPPLFDAAVATSFNLFGISLFSARLVAAVFSVLTLWMVFELAKILFDGKTAFLSALLLGLMPGYFWLSRLALIEMMLMFFFMLGLLLFLKWRKTGRDRYMLLCGVAIGLGILSKYQVAIAGVIILVAMLFLERGRLRPAMSRFGLVVAGAAAVVVPWIAIATRLYGEKIVSNWLYALNIGNPLRSVYSSRYPAPIFYLIDVVWPYGAVHPISMLIYGLCLVGLVYLLWRHRASDKFVLIWFVVIYVFFTVITNKEWRYVLALFPALAIGASVFVMQLLSKLDGIKKIRVDKAKAAKTASVVLIATVAGAAAYSIYDAYTINSYFSFSIPVEPATVYALDHLQGSGSIMVICAFDYFSADMVRFYLIKNGDTTTQVYQYPELPVDTYTPYFNITEFIADCRENNVQYVLTYEYGATVPYYNTTLTLQDVYRQLYESGNFTHISSESTFGENPRRIFIIEFTG
jgi:4-amino-4-deoxy-L-arabinose transferase-like glycosyltransferase